MTTKNTPKVTELDRARLRRVLKRKGLPLKREGRR